MALTGNVLVKTAVQDRYMTFGTLTFDSSYATNGEAVLKSDVGLNDANFDLAVFPSAGYIPEFVKSTGKIKVYRQKDPGNAGGADIALPEVANAVDLSAVSFQFIAFGKVPA